MTRRGLSTVLLLACSLAVAAAQGTTPPPQVPPPQVPPPTVLPPTPPTTSKGTQVRPQPPQAPAPGTIAPQPFSVTAAIIGQVVDDAGRAVPRAVVRLVSHGPSDAVVTDVRGRFFFTGLPSAEYVVVATKTGYHRGGYGQGRPDGEPLPFMLSVGQVVSDMRITVYRSAVVIGVVTDDARTPVVGTKVVALRRQFVDGDWRYEPAGSDTTDDEGAYRIHSLPPGDYIVTTPTSSGAVTEAGDGLTFPTLFYPASRRPLLALPVALSAGQVRYGVNFFWEPVPARAVAGQLSGPGGSTADQLLRLIALDEREMGLAGEAAVTRSEDDGSFRFPGVPEGRYAVEAGPFDAVTPASFWGRTGVVVWDEDVENVRIEMKPGASLSGSIVAARVTPPAAVANTQTIPLPAMAGAPAAPAPAVPRFRDISITVVPEKPGSTSAVTPRVLADGQFTAEGLAPGRYLVRVGSMPAGWYLSSVTVDGEDALDRPIDLSAGDVSDVQVTVTERGTLIRGVARDARLQPAPGASIIVLPARPDGPDQAGWSPNRTRYTRASAQGTFAFGGLPPGNYLVIAVEDALAAGWQEPARVAQIRALATRVSIKDGEETVLQLRVSPLKR
jgi:hypothetical protein